MARGLRRARGCCRRSSNGYFLLFFPVLVVAWLAWFVDWRRAPGRGLAIVAAWAIASLPLLPVLLKYREVHERLGLARKVAEIRDYSAIPASFLHAAPLMKFWREGPAHTYEQYLFTGVTVVLLALAGLVLLLVRKTRGPVVAGRAPILFYLRARSSCGCSPSDQAVKDRIPRRLYRPYSWLLALPGFNGLRVSSRFAMVGTLCLAMAASLAVAHLSKLSGGVDGWVDSRVRGWAHRWRALAGAAVIAGLLVDGMTRPVPVVHASREGDPSRFAAGGSRWSCRSTSTDISVQAMYRSIFQRPAARQRLLRPLSASLQHPVAVALARRYVRPSSTWPGGGLS